MSEDKIIPQIPEDEKSLIGSMLMTPDMIEHVLEQVEPSAMYDTINYAIFKTMVELFDDETPIDVVSVASNLSGVPGASLRLSECMSEVATTENPDFLINKINNVYAQRYCATVSTQIQNMSFNEDSKVGDLANVCEALSDQMENFCNKSGVKRRKRGRLVSVNENREQVEKFFLEGVEKQGIEFRDWPKLAKYFRMVKGTLNIIGGIPSHGKTTFTDACMVNAIIEHNWKFAVFSPENKPYYLHIQPLSEKMVGKPFFKDGNMTKFEMDASLDMLNDHIKFMEPDEENMSHDAIFKLMKDAVKAGDLDGVLIDPWNNLEMNMKNGESESKSIGRHLKKYKMFARYHNLWLGIVAHPTKMYKKPGEKKYQVPTLYDMDGSAHWYNGTDNGVTFYRHFDTNHIELHVQKIKFRNHGRTGVVLMRYDPFNTRLDEITKDQVEDQKPKKKEVNPDGYQGDVFKKEPIQF